MPRPQLAARTSGCGPRARNSVASSSPFSLLPPDVRNALGQLPKATERLSEGAADDAASPFARLSRDEFWALDLLLIPLQYNEVLHRISSEAAAAMLSERPMQLALLRLALSALRVTPGELQSGGSRDYGSVLAFAISVTRSVLHEAGNNGSPPQRLAAATFIRGLLRAQALQAASRQLAALAEALLAVAAEVPGTQLGKGQGQKQQAGEGEQPQQRGVGTDSSLSEDIIVSLSVVARFVYDLVCWVHAFGGTPTTELAAALHDSGVMEHAARALLLALPQVQHGGPGYTRLQSALAASADAYMCAAPSYLEQAPTPAAASQLRAALSGRCVQTAALSLGVATLCAADGGSAYGLPPELLAALPVDMHRGAGANAGGSGHGLPRVRIASLLAALHLLALESRAQPPGRRGALSLALRAGRLGVASAVAAAGAEEALAVGRSSSAGDGARGGNQQQQEQAADGTPPRMVVAPDAAALLCRTALTVSRALLQRAPPGSAHWRADAEEWWRLVVAAVRHTLRFAGEEEQEQLCDCLAWAAEEAKMWSEAGRPLHLPLEPPAVTAAALRGGLLPCLERLMRRAGQAPQGPEAAVLRRLLGTDDITPWRYLAPLLAYGDPRQAAALVVTMGKILRMVDPRVATASAAWQPGAGTQDLFLWIACNMLKTLVQSSSTLPQPREGGPAPVQQLARLMSLATCEWLSVLSRLVLPAMQAALKEDKAHGLGILSGPLTTLLFWLPLLAGQYAAQGTALPVTEAAGGTGADTGAPGPAAGEAPEGAGLTSWRSLVLEEVGAVPLLGTALELAAAECQGQWQGSEKGEQSLWSCLTLRQLVVSCCTVAGMHATPGGCLGAALAAAAGVPPSKSSVPGAGQVPADSRGKAAAAALPWRPEYLRAVAVRLRAVGGDEAVKAADAAEGLAEILVGAVQRSGREEGNVEAGSAAAAADEPPPLPAVRRLLKDALVPPSEARRLLRTCGNPGCSNLAGDSEAGLPVQACSRCGAVGYCCRACQVAHWRAGHGAACKGREKNGGKR